LPVIKPNYNKNFNRIGLTRLSKFEAKSRLETSHTNVWRVSNADFNEEIGQTIAAQTDVFLC